jgi:hypothetical protein
VIIKGYPFSSSQKISSFMNDGEHIPRLKGIEGGGVGDWRIAPLHLL